MRQLKAENLAADEIAACSNDNLVHRTGALSCNNEPPDTENDSNRSHQNAMSFKSRPGNHQARTGILAIFMALSLLVSVTSA